MSQDALFRKIFAQTKTVAVVGWSVKEDRPSHRVAAFLARQGYRVIAVNPGLVGQAALGGVVRASLTEAAKADGPIDMVDIFRRSEDVGPIVDEAIAIGAQTVWMQVGVINHEAGDTARAAGLNLVMDRCPLIEIPRLAMS